MQDDAKITATYLKDDRFDRVKRIPWFDLDAVREKRILMVGAGALGNEVSKNLVLSGFKNIDIVDMDVIERSNLNRCVFFNEGDAERKSNKAEVIKERLLSLDSSTKINSMVGKIQELEEERYKEYDITLGCLDNIAARVHLNAYSYYNRIPYIDGATDGFRGKVQIVLPPQTPCLECGLNRTHMKIMEQRFSCTGKNISYFDALIAGEITTTSVIAAIQVREAVKVACGQKDYLIRHVFYYDGTNNQSEVFELDVNPACPNHLVVNQ